MGLLINILQIKNYSLYNWSIESTPEMFLFLFFIDTRDLQCLKDTPHAHSLHDHSCNRQEQTNVGCNTATCCKHYKILRKPLLAERLNFQPTIFHVLMVGSMIDQPV